VINPSPRPGPVPKPNPSLPKPSFDLHKLLDVVKQISPYDPSAPQQAGMDMRTFSEHPGFRNLMRALASFSSAMPIATGEVLPAGRFQSTPRIPEFSRARGGTYMSVGKANPEYNQGYAGLGGKHQVTTGVQFDNPLRARDQWDALNQLLGKKEASKYFGQFTGPLMAQKLHQLGLSETELDSLTQQSRREHNDAILLDRLVNELARRKGHDVVNYPHNTEHELVDLRSHPGSPGAYPALPGGK
jgi:hypothetical protein